MIVYLCFEKQIYLYLIFSKNQTFLIKYYSGEYKIRLSEEEACIIEFISKKQPKPNAKVKEPKQIGKNIYQHKNIN